MKVSSRQSLWTRWMIQQKSGKQEVSGGEGGGDKSKEPVNFWKDTHSHLELKNYESRPQWDTVLDYEWPPKLKCYNTQ